MAGFIDVVLRGMLLGLTSIALGGVGWLLLVLRSGPGVKPDPFTARALRVVALAAGLAAMAQAAILGVAFEAVSHVTRGSAGPFLETTFATVSVVRIVLAAVVATTAVRLARSPGGRWAWTVLAGSALTLVASSAVLSHAIARLESRGALLLLDATHQVAVAAWVGGLVHLTIYAATARRVSRDTVAPSPGVVVRRFSTLALISVSTLMVAGIVLTYVYVGDPSALVGTAYGVMILSKLVLLAAALGLAAANRRAIVEAASASEPGLRLYRFVEVEMGLGLTLLFAAASLTSLPPSVDVTDDRATVAEVAARFRPTMPHLSSPEHDELIRTADPLMAPPGERKPIERAWSEYNHHWSGLFVLSMGLLAIAERLGVRAARHWPLLFFGLATFMFIRNDPRAWPLGPAGFWESLTLPDVLQHRAFVLLIVLFGGFEWLVRTGRLPRRPRAYVFPLLCALGGGLLLTHSHAMFNLKEEFLTEVTHAPLGILGAFMGWGRWLELRLPESAKVSSWVWTACLTAVGVLLLIYREG